MMVSWTRALAGTWSVLWSVLLRFDSDDGWDYLLVTHSLRLLRWRCWKGHFHGPTLSWPDLVAVASQGATTRNVTAGATAERQSCGGCMMGA